LHIFWKRRKKFYLSSISFLRIIISLDIMGIYRY